MPEATVRFTSRHPASVLAKCLSDTAFVAGGIPQVVAVERTGTTTATWTVEVRIGPISRKSAYRGELLGASDSEVRFRAEGPEAMIDGSVRMTPHASAGTDVEFTLSMKGLGALRSVVDAYLAKRVRGDAEKFAQGLDGRIDAVTSATPPSPSD
jgi:carbon monoxide dehydrogenase subunit G